MNVCSIIPLIIPSFEPDNRLLELLEELYSAKLNPIILVDDGSGEEYRRIFDSAEKEYECIVLRHAVNLGKGRALKDAFNYCLNRWPESEGCVTADADGQHTVFSIEKCRTALLEHPSDLVMGVRNFDDPNVPSKSKYGNKITRGICRWLCGVTVSDTQTGLRAIPTTYMRELLCVQGERFEFETRMLLETKDKYPVFEVPIETVYDSKENHKTHFDPIKDSMRIYRIFGAAFIKFVISSLSSSAVDLLLFALFCNMFKKVMRGVEYVAAATVMARAISATYNYLVNYVIVFRSKATHKQSAIKYAVLALMQMLLSALLVSEILLAAPSLPELAAKIPIDVCLFFVSYQIQREWIYR